jgi:hypothetical protein
MPLLLKYFQCIYASRDRVGGGLVVPVYCGFLGGGEHTHAHARTHTHKVSTCSILVSITVLHLKNKRSISLIISQLNVR